MEKQTGTVFPNKLFCFYQAIANDMIFWAMFDVLILTTCKGFTMVQVSLIFTVAYWASIVMQIPSYYLSRKIGAGGSVILGAFMFLAAALMITFGGTVFIVAVGQSVSLIAGAFQKMSSVILKDATSRSGRKEDYAKIMSAANVIYSVITIFAALSFNTLFRLNENVPMYICTFFCVLACILSVYVSRFASPGSEEVSQDILPGRKVYSFDKTTAICLILSVLGMMIFFLSEDNLKILLEHDLSSEFTKDMVVTVFSGVIIATRVVKLAGNFLNYIAGKRSQVNLKSFFLIISTIATIGIMAFASFFTKGWPQIALVGLAIFAKAAVYDAFTVHMLDFMLNRLKKENMMMVLYIRNLAVGLSSALASTMATAIIAAWDIFGVVILICVLITIMVATAVVFRSSIIRMSVGRASFHKWGKKDMDLADDLTVAAAVLMDQYRIVRTKGFTPNVLAGSISDIKEAGKVYKGLGIHDRHPYSEEKLMELYIQGHPCAILVRNDDMDSAKWMPVIFLDDDGGMVWNSFSDEMFINEFDNIEEIISFEISK